ncbi:MAG: inner rane protein [Chthonomonadales bacterium]|nr:inner rane protein [Chthonomonadales bacterium]
MFIGIVADDLTGAADSVAPFAQRGYAAGVGLSVASGVQGTDREWDALALNTELRDQESLKPTLIVSIARRATRRLIQRAPQLYFKKIDSTLRGHLRPELDGMLRELPGRLALICPASPANGRSVRNGVLQVQGIPLAETEFVRGAAEPEKFATVRTAFGMADDPMAAEIDLALLREGCAAVTGELDRQLAAGARVVFCDAETPEDLCTLAQVTLLRPERYLPVGSAGLTRAIAELRPPAVASDSPAWDTEPFTRGRVLVVIGSLHPISRQQARRMVGRVGVKPIILQQEDRWTTRAEIRSFQESFLAPEMISILITPEERNPQEKHYPIVNLFKMIRSRAGNPDGVPSFDGYVVTGGHTAQQVCLNMNGVELQIFGESEPGIVRAILSRSLDLPSVPIILKAGGFGDEGTLARCVGLE